MFEDALDRLKSHRQDEPRTVEPTVCIRRYGAADWVMIAKLKCSGVGVPSREVHTQHTISSSFKSCRLHHQCRHSPQENFHSENTRNMKNILEQTSKLLDQWMKIKMKRLCPAMPLQSSRKSAGRCLALNVALTAQSRVGARSRTSKELYK